MPPKPGVLRQLRQIQSDIESEAFRICRRGKGITGSKKVRQRRIKAWFGVSSEVMAELFWLLQESGTLHQRRHASTEHFLWGMMLLKSYETEEVLASRVGGVTEETFRTWSWFFIQEMSYLETQVVRS